MLFATSVDTYFLLDDTSEVDEEETHENTLIICGFQIKVDFNEDKSCKYVQSLMQ